MSLVAVCAGALVSTTRRRVAMLASSGDATDDWGLQSFVVDDDDFGELIQSPEMDGVGLNVQPARVPVACRRAKTAA